MSTSSGEVWELGESRGAAPGLSQGFRTEGWALERNTSLDLKGDSLLVHFRESDKLSVSRRLKLTGLAARFGDIAERQMASPVNPQVTEDGVTETAPSDAGSAVASAEPSNDEASAPPGSTEEKKTLVFFDLETTGLEKNCEIVQVAAVSGEKIFEKYILPRNPFSAGAAAITGLQVMNGVLYLREEPQPTCSLQDAMAAFLQFLQSLDRPLLAGHNIWKFDCPFILRAWEELSMKDQFARCVTGFLDTLSLARDIVPRSEVNSYRQTDLVQTFLKKSYEAHNAIEDVRSLQELYSVLKFTPEQKRRSQFSLSQLECLVSLQPLIDDKILFYQLADKLAMQEVSLEKLKSAHQQGGALGLKTLLQSLGHVGLNHLRLSNFFSR